LLREDFVEKIISDGVSYTIEAKRQILVVPDVQTGTQTRIFLGWQPQFERLDIPRGGFEWISIEQNGSKEPDQKKIYHPFHFKHGIEHFMFERQGENSTILILKEIREKPKSP